MALGAGRAWVGNSGDGTLSVITRTNSVDMTLAQDATTITAAGDGTLWITHTAARVRHFRPG